MSEQPHILVVDDDRRIRDLTARYLSEQGFNVVTANDAADARDKMKSLAFDLLVLDIMMPGENGLELTVNLRTESDVPILLLASDHDQVTFLHHAEHVVDVGNKRVVRFQVPVREDGRRVWRWMEEFDTAEPCHPAWPSDVFRRIVDAYLAQFAHGRGRIGDADCVLLDAQPLLGFAIERLADLAADGDSAAPAGSSFALSRIVWICAFRPLAVVCSAVCVDVIAANRSFTAFTVSFTAMPTPVNVGTLVTSAPVPGSGGSAGAACAGAGIAKFANVKIATSNKKNLLAKRTRDLAMARGPQSV